VPRKRRLAAILVVLLLATILIGSFVPIGRATASALLLLPEFFPGAPVRPLAWLTPAPIKSTIQLAYAGGASAADLYVPSTPGKHGAVIIFLGVAQAGRDDPRVVRLGEGLARVGLETIVPESQDLLNSKVDPAEIDEVVAAFQFLANRPEVDPQRIGIGGFCIGASLSLVAAEDPRINQQVALVNSFTGYDDLATYVVSIVTHSVEPYPPEPGVARLPWEPSPNATAVLADHLISLDPLADEAKLLRAAAHDPQAPRPDPARLSSTGRTIWSLLTTRDPAEAQRLLGELPPAARDALQRLSPDTHLDQLHAKVFIMHDRDDATVPYVESRRLAAQLPPSQVEYDEFELFNHVDPTAAVSPLVFLRDTARLAGHMIQIIELLQVSG
jgi:acetyl esterase/lipase